jgi:hypothetical protein
MLRIGSEKLLFYLIKFEYNLRIRSNSDENTRIGEMHKSVGGDECKSRSEDHEDTKSQIESGSGERMRREMKERKRKI